MGKEKVTEVGLSESGAILPPFVRLDWLVGYGKMFLPVSWISVPN